MDRIALDATYGVGAELSGIGVYSREILLGLCDAHPETRFLFHYRAHRWKQSARNRLPSNARRRLLADWLPVRADLFHGLNQRMPRSRLRRSVCTFHDLFVLTGEYSTPEFRVRFAAQAREAATRANLIIAVSEFTARQVCDLLHVERSRIRVIHHGVHTPPQVSSQREPVILHVGAMQVRKNLIRLVEAFERVGPPWRLVLAGASSGYGATDILLRIHESPARDRIELANYVTAARLQELYRLASIFAFPSLDEGFGMPVLEAMAFGVPVLASRRSALPEVCGGAALLVDPFDSDAIHAGLSTLIYDSASREDLIQRGFLRARERSWSAAVEGTWRVYRELVT